MRLILFAFVLAFVVACAPSTNGAEGRRGWTHVDVVSDTGVHGFTVEIADDPEEQSRGLMFRRHLADDAGMLFLYSEEKELSYWMHNTYIPLDIIFINREGRIVSIQRNAQPLSDTSLPSYIPAIAVLEVNGGTADRLGFGEGDEVRHPFFNQFEGE